MIRCIEAGAEDYLPKPFNAVLLRARISACLERKRWRDRERRYMERIELERQRHETLLRNILPGQIVTRLNNGEAVIADRPHPEQGFRTCLGILSLARSYGDTRVEAACRRGLLIKARSVASIRSILKNGLDRAVVDETPDHEPLRHGNIRGQGYFH